VNNLDGDDLEEGEGSKEMEVSGEGSGTKGIRDPKKPSRQEVEDHERDHIPFRSWCSHCMRGKSKASPHRAGQEEGQERAKPIVSLDYAYLGVPREGNKAERDKKEKEWESKGHTPMLVMHDSESKSVFTYVAGHKGANDELCNRVVRDLDFLGYKEIVMKGDQEYPLQTLLSMIKASWDGRAVPENSAVGESESNGAVERAIQTVEGQIRTMKDALEHKIGQEVPPDAMVITWMVAYASTLIRRCLVGRDGKTAHQRHEHCHES